MHPTSDYGEQFPAAAIKEKTLKDASTNTSSKEYHRYKLDSIKVDPKSYSSSFPKDFPDATVSLPSFPDSPPHFLSGNRYYAIPITNESIQKQRLTEVDKPRLPERYLPLAWSPEDVYYRRNLLRSSPVTYDINNLKKWWK